jgi:putative proteasome-type protease
MLIYRKDSFSFDEYYCFDEDNEYLVLLRRNWETNLRKAVAALPVLNKESVKPMQISL